MNQLTLAINLGVNEKTISKLRDLAIKLKAERQEHSPCNRRQKTNREVRIGARFKAEFDRLRLLESWVLGILQKCEEGRMPSILNKVTSRKVLDILSQYLIDPDIKVELAALERAGLTCKEDIESAIAVLEEIKIVEINIEEEREQRLSTLEQNLFRKQIAGFVPSTKLVVKEILELAQIEEWHKVLEPHGGRGDLIEGLLAFVPRVHVDTGEKDDLLREILKLKGYSPRYSDFLQAEGLEEQYDRVIMNPPWGVDLGIGHEIDHIYKGFQCCQKGGRLVAIAPAGLESNNSPKYREFIKWLTLYQAEVWDLGTKAFKKSDFVGSISTVAIVVDKPEYDPIDELEELTERLNDNFPNKDNQKIAVRLRELARGLHTIDLISVNERELGADEERQKEMYEKEVIEIAEKLGTTCVVLEDSRGYPIKIKMPDGRSNTIGGEALWGISGDTYKLFFP